MSCRIVYVAWQASWVSADWFRSPDWDDDTRADFEMRLGRARGYNRPQYLRIKALALRDAGLIEPARALLMQVAEQPEVHGFEVAFAQELLGDLAVIRNEPVEAERFYRWVLAEHPSANGTSGNVEVSLAELLIDRNREPERSEAQALLTSWMDRPGLKFDHTLFRWHLALIAIAEQLGDQETTQRAARTALTLAGRGDSSPNTATSGWSGPIWRRSIGSKGWRQVSRHGGRPSRLGLAGDDEDIRTCRVKGKRQQHDHARFVLARRPGRRCTNGRAARVRGSVPPCPGRRAHDRPRPGRGECCRRARHAARQVCRVRFRGRRLVAQPTVIASNR
jgi:hypothetical protein